MFLSLLIARARKPFGSAASTRGDNLDSIGKSSTGMGLVAYDQGVHDRDAAQNSKC